MRPIICLTSEMKRIEDDILKIEEYRSSGAGMIELRLDLRKDPLDRIENLAEISKSGIRTLITIRPSWEGGSFQGSEKERFNLLMEAMRHGPDMVDVESGTTKEFRDRIIEEAALRGIDVIVSHHGYDLTPEPDEIVRDVGRCWYHGGSIAKAVYACDTVDDLLRVLEAGDRLKGFDGRYCLMGMGKMGAITRIISNSYGSHMVYACLKEPVVEGQVSIEVLLRCWDMMEGSN